MVVLVLQTNIITLCSLKGSGVISLQKYHHVSAFYNQQTNLHHPTTYLLLYEMHVIVD